MRKLYDHYHIFFSFFGFFLGGGGGLKYQRPRSEMLNFELFRGNSFNIFYGNCIIKGCVRKVFSSQIYVLLSSNNNIQIHYLRLHILKQIFDSSISSDAS